MQVAETFFGPACPEKEIEAMNELDQEGILRGVKPMLSGGLRKNWQRNLLNRFYREKALSRILQTVSKDIPKDEVWDTEATDDESEWKQKSFHTYPSSVVDFVKELN